MDQENQPVNGTGADSSAERTQNESSATGNRKSGLPMVKIGAGVIVIALIVFGIISISGNSLSGKDSIDVAAVIATVNGEEISGTDFKDFFETRKALLGESQESVSDDVLKQQTLDLLITKTLLLQKVKEGGIAVTDAEVNTQLEQVRAQFPDEGAYADALTTQGFTTEGFESALREDLVIQKYLTSQVDVSSVTVTDAEVQAEYDLAAARQEGLPGIDVLGEPIRAQLLQQKQQQLATEFINTLKAGSEIEIAE